MNIEDLQLDDFASFERQMQGEEVELPAADTKTSEDTEEAPESKTAADSETDEDDEDEGKPEAGKKKGGFQRRIDKLTQDRKALEAENEALKQKLAGGTPAAAAAEPAAKPKPDDFTSYDDYVEALSDWKVEQAEAKREAKRQAEEGKRREQAAQAELVNAWKGRAEKFAETAPDFDDVLAAVKTPISQALYQTLLDSEHGPAIAYDLAKNPKEIERLNALSPIAAAREIGRLEAARVKAADATPTKQTKVTKAPEPISPVTKTGKARVPSLNDPDVPYAEFERLANERFARR